jgi:hypothetical protein
MDKEPKKPGGENDTERDDIQEIRVNSIPLMVLIAGVLSSVDFVDWMFTVAEMLVVFVLTYQILGRALYCPGGYANFGCVYQQVSGGLR